MRQLKDSVIFLRWLKRTESVFFFNVFGPDIIEVIKRTKLT